MRVRNRVRRYVVYVPHEYDSAKPWPVVLFLHGRGERGDDGLKQTEVGIGTAIRKWPERFPCLVIMPQCPKASYWDGAWEDVDAAFCQTRDEYSVDHARIYLSGLSMGGYGAWGYAARNPDLFAAMIPICGGGTREQAKAAAHMPIWAFHGAEDPTVPASESRAMVDAVKEFGGRIWYTEYPGVNHFSWERTYGDPKVIRWLLTQRRNSGK